LSVTDQLLEIITLAAAIITAAGVFLGPYIAERIRKRGQARQIHLKRIKDYCLSPLVASIDQIWVNIRIDEMTSFDFGMIGKLKRDSKYRKIDLISYVDPELGFDSLLYGDLQNHFPDLSKEINRVNATALDKEYITFQKARTELVMKLYTFFGPFVVSKYGQKPVENQQFINRAVVASLLRILDISTEEWPNMSSSLREVGELVAIDEIIKKPELEPDKTEFKRAYHQINSDLNKLREQISMAIESEKSLKGKCSYL
jgi:hypothetical protein